MKIKLERIRTLKILFIILIVFNLLCCTNKDVANQTSQASKDKLLKTIEEFNKAFEEGNVNVLEAMVTKNYVHTNGTSKSIGKKDWFSYLSKRENEIKSGNLEVLEYRMEDMEIEYYENMAIVTGKVIVSNNANDDIQNNQYRITNVWHNDNGNWKRAGFHDGKIK